MISKTLLLTKSWLLRLWDVIRVGEYDILYVLKTAYPLGPPIFEMLASKSHCKLVVDYDDAIFLHRESVDHQFLDRLKATHYFNRILKYANAVFVPNTFLEQHSLKYNSAVYVVPEAEDTERLIPREDHTRTTDCVIGWVGSPSTVSYLDLIKDALKSVCEKYPNIVVRTIGGRWEANGVNTEYVPWTLGREVENLQSFDIGLMPLTDTDWSRGKSGCKLRQYMSVGVPAVASAVGYNCELIRDSSEGFLVKNVDSEWIGALESLICNSNLRNSIARTARDSVVERFAISRVGPVLKAALTSVIKTA